MVEAGIKTRNMRNTRSGVVVSRSGDKSIVVKVERRKAHPLYGKIMRQKRNFQAHDEANEAQVGDKVTIMESRPLSKTKRWRVVDVTKKSA